MFCHKNLGPLYELIKFRETQNNKIGIIQMNFKATILNRTVGLETRIID